MVILIGITVLYDSSIIPSLVAESGRETKAAMPKTDRNFIGR